mgnify:CR=1 FL=1
MGLKPTTRYYRRLKVTNPTKYKETRLAQQSAYQKTKKGKEIKNNANELNRELGTYGNGDGLDAAHYASSKTKGRTQKPGINRQSRKKNKSKLHIA